MSAGLAEHIKVIKIEYLYEFGGTTALIRGQ